MKSGFHGLLPSSRRVPQKQLNRILPFPMTPSSSSAVKIKALLSLCIGLSLLLIAARAASAVAAVALHRQHFSAASFTPASVPGDWKGYTILINTWKRDDLLQKSVLHYSTCVGVDSIHVVWSEPDPPSDSLYDALRHSARLNSKGGKEIEVIFDFNHEDSLNNRFKEIKDLKTDALFSIDDDVIFPCKSVEFAFSVWKSAASTMVGFVPRMHWLDKSNNSIGRYFYGGWWSVWWMGTYSMVLSKAAFFHKRYLHLYSCMPQTIRNYVDRNRNCEDIAMAFLIANETGAPPIWVQGQIFEMGSSGISSLGSHRMQRTQCLNDFSALYGRMPLVATNVKAIDSRGSWLW
ncbi:alpha-1,4-N-acetylglucosaminyltransferase EXTL3 [Apostasia shenzhenica]|uniref:Alpha-1,4-N-acetylglucosaminyltransferase EXTL3 n=1 Tax=Apostasia shenzhenica TaxID=1088818 RepID=A0A2I0BAS3_9ASPA|nr:alpha-1,4-N-acetylglucosaminyltransferase EXTL3 [Apostasia shenzhenica]